MFFIDSNIFIEGLKIEGLIKAKKILNSLRDIPKSEIALNSIVKSEVVYIIAFWNKILSPEEILQFLDIFSFLEINKDIDVLFSNFIKTYNLKPNDALILATCKFHKIENLISLDEDFKIPCEKEKINLINSDKKLNKIIKKI